MKTPRLPYHQLAAESFNLLLAAKKVLFNGHLGQGFSALIWLRVSQINGCHFCIAKHTGEAREAGEAEARIATLAQWRDSDAFTPAEQAALEYAECITHLVDGVPDSVFLPLKAHFSDAYIAELTVTIGFMNALNRIAISMYGD
ncbi:carboxymuconolactone decarboxylase family protein [Paludibacterium paludis]|uniref:Alkyl hydroperoxide reductase AhpD n=1 Tax=Paludibacterium paludis TaxID=1225769 RepID=A0A918NYJ9_9NEIS|nr:carboxymuconolactone decarboxylase family protein [Paludibacterium paludis]GGY06007.1 alkyl hydroperoxide reductase AhpD [Paludibacterium paludis]